ncbi:helicase associated domain-containing protein, partial [Streptomyces chryseus]
MERAQQLTAIGEDWNCPWPLDWQRHYRVLAALVDADGHLPDIQPGVLMDGNDIGRWLERQTQPGTWAHLTPKQQERLSQLGVQPLKWGWVHRAGRPAVRGAGRGACPVRGKPAHPARPELEDTPEGRPGSGAEPQ